MVLNLKGKEIIIKRFAECDADIFMDFQDDVINRLEDKSTFVKETREECMLALKDGIILGAYMEGELVGTWSLVSFGEMEDNYGYDFGFSKEKILKTINFAHAIVKEKARGMGLDKKVVDYAVELMKDRFDYFACTIALSNLPSIKAMVRNKFYIRLFKFKYGGYPRYMLMRDETEKNAFDETTKVNINYEETEKAKELLAQGYCVVDVTKDNNFVLCKPACVCL